MGRVSKSDWGRRASAAGLDQVTLAAIAGTEAQTVSRELHRPGGDGAQRYLRALIIAWELMSPEQRHRWCEAAELAHALAKDLVC